MEKLNIPLHEDYQRDNTIPDNKKLSADELNRITGKIDEIVDKTNSVDLELENIQGWNTSQDDLINGLQSDLDNQVVINENQDELLQTLEQGLNNLNSWKSQMTSADTDNLVNTLTELLAVFQSVPEGTDIYGLLASKVNVSDIVNTLTSLDTTKVLSANQGKILKDLIDSLTSALANKMNIPSGIGDKQVPRYSTTSSTFVGGVIYDDGTNVGIGTSTPTAKLDVAGIIKTNSAIDFTQISRWAYFGAGANRMYVTDAGMLILNDSAGNQRLIPILPYNSQQLYSKSGMPVVGTGTTNILDFSTTYGTAGIKLWVGDNQGGDANIIFDVMSNAMNKTSRPFPFVSGNWFYTMVGILGNMVFQIDGDAGVYFFSGAKWEKLGREYLTKRTDLSVIDTEAENEKSVFASKSTYTTTELNAIKQLVYSLKLNNLWQKMEFIYPMVGGTLDSCSKDLISSNNNAYNITWYNTANLIVSSLGIKSADVSTNIGYGDTNFIPSVNSVFGSEGYTFVLGDTTANRINYIFGSQAGGGNRTKISSWGHLDISGTCYYYYSGTSNTPKGVYTQQRDVSSCASIFNGSNKYIERYYNNAGSLTNTSIYILSMNGATSDSSISCKDRLQFCCKHKSLSMAEIQVLKTIIDTFEQSLGRKTW